MAAMKGIALNFYDDNRKLFAPVKIFAIHIMELVIVY